MYCDFEAEFLASLLQSQQQHAWTLALSGLLPEGKQDLTTAEGLTAGRGD